jgi:hypothetical protein
MNTTPSYILSHNLIRCSRILLKMGAIDAAEFSAPDCEIAAQLNLPCTLIGGVFSTHPIKRHIVRVSQPIKPPNTLIVSPIKDRVDILFCLVFTYYIRYLELVKAFYLL